MCVYDRIMRNVKPVYTCLKIIYSAKKHFWKSLLRGINVLHVCQNEEILPNIDCVNGTSKTHYSVKTHFRKLFLDGINVFSCVSEWGNIMRYWFCLYLFEKTFFRQDTLIKSVSWRKKFFLNIDWHDMKICNMS